ncbi:MAG: hypothetical protein AAFU63_10060 [Pseudomonadota bacterium]
MENINKTCKPDGQDYVRPIRTTSAQVALLASEPLREIIELYWNAFDNRRHLSWQSIQLAAKDRTDQLGIPATAKAT